MLTTIPQGATTTLPLHRREPFPIPRKLGDIEEPPGPSHAPPQKLTLPWSEPGQSAV